MSRNACPAFSAGVVFCEASTEVRLNDEVAQGRETAEGRDRKHWGDFCATRGIREVSRGHSSWKQRAVSTTEVSRSNEGLNVELFQML